MANYQPGDEIAAAISSADKCLYEGKEAGRNRSGMTQDPEHDRISRLAPLANGILLLTTL